MDNTRGLLKELADSDSTVSVDELVNDWKKKHKQKEHYRGEINVSSKDNKRIPYAAALSIKQSIETKLLAHPHFEDWTTEWDRTFLNSVLDQINSKQTLSVRQVSRLKEISTKLADVSPEDIKKYEI